MELVLIVLATFWCWETARYALERYLPSAFAATRALHPVVVALLPLGLLWPEWVTALALAGATGLLVALVDRFVAGGSSSPAPVVLPRRRTGGLPPLP